MYSYRKAKCRKGFICKGILRIAKIFILQSLKKNENTDHSSISYPCLVEMQ